MQHENDRLPTKDDSLERVQKRSDIDATTEGAAPNLRSRVVVAVFERRDQAQAVVGALEQQGISRENISLVTRDEGAAPEVGAEATKSNQGIAVGAGAGALVGGLVGLAALTVPGVGPLLASGPLAAALGALSGAALGGLVGSFTGLGIPTEQASQYVEAVRSGGSVVAVTVADEREEQFVDGALQRHAPQSLQSYTNAL